MTRRFGPYLPTTGRIASPPPRMNAAFFGRLWRELAGDESGAA